MVKINSISILIPAHNEERNIAIALDNMAELRRHYPDTQVICGLDGCTDNTKEVAKRYDFVEIVEFHRRQGKHIVVDEMMRSVKNDIVVICDADRRFICGKGELEKLLECFDDPEVGGVGDYYTTTYDDEKAMMSNNLLFLGDAWSTLFLLEYKMKRFTKRIDGKLYANGNGLFYTNFFRRDVLEKFRTRTLADDLERTINIMNEGYSVRLLETEERPHFKAVYSEMGVWGFLKTKVRGMVAQRQIEEFYGKFSMGSAFSLALHVLANMRRVKRPRAVAGIFLWWSVVVLARIRYAFMLNKDIDTGTGWKMRMC